jgi:hypothetical protein
MDTCRFLMRGLAALVRFSWRDVGRASFDSEPRQRHDYARDLGCAAKVGLLRRTAAV